MDFDRTLNFVLAAEGGYANVEGDTGGETYKGVARNHNPHWGGWLKIDILKEQGVTNPQELNSRLAEDHELQAEVATLYKSNYWNPIQGDKLPWPVNCVVFDCAVNSGPRLAIRLLQKAMTVKQDGALGPITLGEVARWAPSNLASKVIAVRKEHYQGIVEANPPQAKFLVGWLNRLDHLGKFLAEAA